MDAPVSTGRALRRLLPVVFAAALAGGAAGEARTWTSLAGGRTIEAEYRSSADGKVTIRRAKDGKEFTIALDTLSEDDREWVRAKEAAMAEERAAQDLREAKDNPYKKLVTGDWERHEESGLKFRLFGDRSLTRPGKGDEAAGYPLVIFLHGRGGDVMSAEQPWCANYFSAANNYRKRPCYVLVPQCPPAGGWRGQSADAVLSIAKSLVQHLYVDPKRIYLTGYSMGGFGTFHLLAQEPGFFAAGAPVAGGANPRSAAAMKDVPVWVFHGAKDPTVNVEQSRGVVEALKKAGADPKYTEFPDGDHGITDAVYGDDDFHKWLFAQRRE